MTMMTMMIKLFKEYKPCVLQSVLAVMLTSQGQMSPKCSNFCGYL